MRESHDNSPSVTPTRPALKAHLAKVREAVARRGGVGGSTSGGSDAGNVGNTQESDAGGEEDENLFVALCNSGVLTIQHDIDSLCEATLLSVCPYADGLKRSVIYDNDKSISSTSTASNSLNSLPDTPPHTSPSLPVSVWDMSAI